MEIKTIITYPDRNWVRVTTTSSSQFNFLIRPESFVVEEQSKTIIIRIYMKGVDQKRFEFTVPSSNAQLVTTLTNALLTLPSQ